MPKDDELWTHALRASLDAVVLQFEAQARAHASVVASLGTQREETLRQQLATQGAALASLRAELSAREQSARDLDAALQREAAEGARLRSLLAQRDAELAAARARAESAAQELSAKERALGALGEQFAAEESFARGALLAGGSVLLDAVGAALGAPVEATPGCYGALKSKRSEVVLAVAMRDRGRTVAKAPLTEPEVRALEAMAAAAGCELVAAPVGARYAPAAMEKVGTRPEPAEEDMVLDCAMPGLRAAGAPGLAVQPRVIVGTA